MARRGNCWRTSRRRGETLTRASRGAELPAVSAAIGRSKSARHSLSAVAALVVLAVASALFVSRFRQLAEPPSREYTQLTNFADSATWPALSPDGRMLAFIRGGSSPSRAGLRQADCRTASRCASPMTTCTSRVPRSRLTVRASHTARSTRPPDGTHGWCRCSEGSRGCFSPMRRG